MNVSASLLGIQPVCCRLVLPKLGGPLLPKRDDDVPNSLNVLAEAPVFIWGGKTAGRKPECVLVVCEWRSRKEVVGHVEIWWLPTTYTENKICFNNLTVFYCKETHSFIPSSIHSHHHRKTLKICMFIDSSIHSGHHRKINIEVGNTFTQTWNKT